MVLEEIVPCRLPEIVRGADVGHPADLGVQTKDLPAPIEQRQRRHATNL
jgi:hypothetical protein